MLERIPGSFISLSASWMAPEHPNGIILGYMLLCNSPSETFRNFFNSSVQHFILSNLEAATRYACSVLAFNRAGHGPSSIGHTTTPQHSE